MVNISQPNKPIPELKIGDGKLKKRFEIGGWFRSLKDFCIKLTINW